VLVPAAFAGGRRLARAADSVGGPTAVSALAAWAGVGLLAIGLLARLTYAHGTPASVCLLALVPVWGAGLVWTLLSARRKRGPGVALLRGGAPRRVWTIAAGLACACILAFLSSKLLRPIPLGAGLAIASGLTVVHLRFRSASRFGRASLLLDVAVIALVILSVTDVSGYLEYLRPDARTLRLDDGRVMGRQLFLYSHRIHEGFWLGPLNDMLHGRPMLVQTWSQYGVGSLYFFAAFFQVAPLGYGALGLLGGFLTAVQNALAYAVVRLAGCPKTLAVPAIAAAVLGLVFGVAGSPNDYPSIGGMRYGIPWLIVALAVLSARFPGRRRLLLAAATALLGIASVWSFETFAYAGATVTGVAAFEAGTLQAGRLRAFARSTAVAAGCCAVAHLTLAMATRTFAGSWPNWAPYLAFLHDYSGKDLFFLVVPPWSPGLLVALVYLASAIAVAGLVASRHAMVVERRPALVALAATSGLGIASFTYFVANSHPYALLVVTLPAVVEGCVWAALIGDRLVRAPRALAIASVVAGLWLAALLGISGVSEFSPKWRRTALAQMIPDGGRNGSIRDALPRLWRSPPSDSRVLEAQALLNRHTPRGAPVLVIVAPELSVETLVRSGRVNLLPISHPQQENIVPDQAIPRVLRAIDRLRPGTLMLAQPDIFDPIEPPSDLLNELVALQKLAVDRIRARFDLQEIERSPSGLAIVRLVPRR